MARSGLAGHRVVRAEFLGVWSVAVVVAAVGAEHVLEVAATEDEYAAETATPAPGISHSFRAAG